MGKLVRDKVPAIIRATGDEAGVEDLLHELADVQEVIRAILAALDWDVRALEEAVQTKAEARGAFTARLWLE